MMGNFILNIESISKSFITNKKKSGNNHSFVLNNLSLQIPKGVIYAIIGGNGTGKTTLFNLISGILKVDSGKILYNNGINSIDISKMSINKIAEIGIGRSFQEVKICNDLTVLENMLITDYIKIDEVPFYSLFKQEKHNIYEKDREKRAVDLIKNLLFIDTSYFNDVMSSNLSYGQQRILGIIRLLMNKFNLILLDEPTSGVNKYISDIMSSLFKKIIKEENKTIVIIEHNIDFVLKVADYCAFISDGSIAAFGTPADVLNNSEVRKNYLGI